MSSPPISVSRTVATALVLSSVLLAACGGASRAAPPATTAPAQPAALEVDWAARTVTGLAAGPVTVDFCEGEAPFLCFSSEGEHLGVVELVSFPTSGYDALEEVVAAGGDESAALGAVAELLVTEMTADRAEGCGDGYQVVADEQVPAIVAGVAGLRSGFRGVVDGTTVEHVIVHSVIVDGILWILNAAGYDDGGCLPREGEFDLAGLQSAVPLIGELVAGTRLPQPDHATASEG